MIERIQINKDMTVGKQPPSTEDLKTMAREGFKAVANLRTEDEQDQPLTPKEEGERVRALGMDYLHYPVKSSELSMERVDAFRDELARLPRPLFAHCRAGKRSGAFLMMQLAAESGMTGEETLRKAEEMGFECDQPELNDFVKNYVDTRKAA